MAKKRAAADNAINKRACSEEKTSDPVEADKPESTDSTKEENGDDDISEDTKFKLKERIKRAGEILTDGLLDALVILEVPYNMFLRFFQKLNTVAFFLLASVVQCWVAVYVQLRFALFLAGVRHFMRVNFQFPLSETHEFLLDFRNRFSGDFKIFFLAMVALFFVNDVLNVGRHEDNYFVKVQFVWIAVFAVLVFPPYSDYLGLNLTIALAVLTFLRPLFEAIRFGLREYPLNFMPLFCFNQFGICMFSFFIIYLFEATKFVEDFLPDLLIDAIMNFLT